MTADDILAAARACIGTPFRHQGRLPGVALDCAGLIIAVAKSMGVDCKDVAGYGRLPSGQLLQTTLSDQPSIAPVPIADRRPGDILLMRFSGDPQHLAIDAGKTLIHSYQAVGKVCEHRFSEDWERKLVSAYRFRDIT